MSDYLLSKGIGGHHRGHKGRSDEWLTPPSIISALGAFDLDPCSPVGRPWDTAKRHLTIEDDGLSADWDGRVWLNPPYGPELGAWLKKLARHGHGTALVFARTETDAFHQHVWPVASAIMFLWGRINFHKVDGSRATANAGGPSVLIAYGRDDTSALRRSRLRGAFVRLGGAA